MPVYHFTDNARLPWILDAGELRPGRGTLGNFPAIDFLWATKDENGSPTSALMNYRQIYKEGKILMVRFTIPDENFVQWPDAIKPFPAWNTEHIRVLELVARENGENPKNWVCSTVAVPKDRWIGLHWRSYRSKAWTPLSFDSPVIRDGKFLGVSIDGVALFSEKYQQQPTGTTAYRVRLAR